jgi:peptide/nickel transport system permease protein
MLRFGLWQAGRFAASLVGAILLSALLAALSHPTHGFWSFVSMFSDKTAHAFAGDFGSSLASGHAALRDVAGQFPATLQLISAGAAIALLVGLPLGLVLSANRLLRAGAPLMQIVAAMPVFVAALGLIWLSVRVLHWPQPSSTIPDPAAGALRSLIMPAVTVGLAGAACVQLALRDAAAAAREAPYRTGLRMMGLAAWDIDLRYTLPEVLAGIFRDLGNIVLALLSAAAVSEWVFHRNGAAALFLHAVDVKDWNVAACVLLIFAAVKLAADFVGAICSRLLAPAEVAL